MDLADVEEGDVAELDEAAEEAADEGPIVPPGEGVDVEAPPPASTSEQLADEARIDEDGRVWCTVPPYHDYKPVGRITTWPKTVFVDKQNVGIRCCLHFGCSVTRKRSKFTNRQVLVWLFSGQVLEAGSSAPAFATAKDEHKRTSLALL
ncbi:unnamed protein product [Polarella glacialis]|uniref:Uncharacterized protein n=1 Tax=Polarella glacialis TaxID=89957 RepID=A0A813FY76_POLGL|nr:unnamed protein product [Polarella glacialis]